MLVQTELGSLSDRERNLANSIRKQERVPRTAAELASRVLKLPRKPCIRYTCLGPERSDCGK